jgi:hypothetical protein
MEAHTVPPLSCTKKISNGMIVAVYKIGRITGGKGGGAHPHTPHNQPSAVKRDHCALRTTGCAATAAWQPQRTQLRTEQLPSHGERVGGKNRPARPAVHVEPAVGTGDLYLAVRRDALVQLPRPS